MYGFTVCVVLMIAGNASSFVLNRTQRDLEQKIYDIYGPPNIPRHLPPMHTAHRKPHHMQSNPDQSPMRDDAKEFNIPQGVLDDLFGPPPKKSNTDAESSAPRFHSAIIDVENARQKEEKEVAKIFGTPSSFEAMTATKNSTASNETALINFDDRFLSESLLRTQWNNNREESKTEHMTTTENSQTQPQPEPEPPSRERSVPLEPGKERGFLKPEKERGLLEPGKEQGLLEPGSLEPVKEQILVEPSAFEHRHQPLVPVPPDTNHIEPKRLEPKQPTLITTLETNASSKNVVSNFLVIFIVCFSIEKLVFN